MILESREVSLPVRPWARSLVGCAARRVVFVELRAQGRRGFGECAPLPGLHDESLDSCLKSMDMWGKGQCETASFAPCAAYCLSSALETLNGLGARQAEPAKVANFFPGTFEQCDQAALDSLAGAEVVKIKWGRDSESNDRALLDLLCKSLPTTRFRIDGNRLMTRAECVNRLQGVDAGRVEYLEEPLRDPTQLSQLARSKGVAIALDEMVVDQTEQARQLRESLAGDGCVAAWVLRMSSIGSLVAIRAKAAEAARLGADAVLSTAYESSYSLRLAVHLAAQIPNARRAHGLGTAGLLERDTCPPALPQSGLIDGSPLPIPLEEEWK